MGKNMCLQFYAPISGIDRFTLIALLDKDISLNNIIRFYLFNLKKNTNNVLIVGSNSGGSLQVNYDSFIEVMESDYKENVEMNQTITTFFIEQVGINKLIHR